MQRIYLDNNSSTAVDTRVIEAMLQDLRSNVGNPSSIHFFGQESRNRLTKARTAIAKFLRVKPGEIIFTSGGTEGLNMVIRGILENNSESRGCGHVISSTVEHAAVYSTLKSLSHPVTFLSPGFWGAIKPEQVLEAIQPNTILITLMAVNNETGVKTDIESIARIALERKIPFVVDGISLMGKEVFSVPEGVSAMCFSGHKFHAPKGIGFNFIHTRLKLKPIHTGGDQEYQRRGGTENTSGIVGLAEAVRLLETELPLATERMKSLRDRLEQGIRSNFPNVMINGLGPRIANTSNLTFPGIEGETLLRCLDLEGVAVSLGSACASGALEPSRILLNMGISRELARSAIRFSLSRFTNEQEIDQCIKLVVKHLSRLSQ
jgi:cysteine desulfurase